MDPTNRILRYLPAPLNPGPLDLRAKSFGNIHRERTSTREPKPQGSLLRRAMIDAYFGELQAGTNQPWHTLEDDPRTIPDYWTPPIAKKNVPKQSGSSR